MSLARVYLRLNDLVDKAPRGRDERIGKLVPEFSHEFRASGVGIVGRASSSRL